MPPAAVARTIGFIEQTGRAHDVEHPVLGTIATTDGSKLWFFRYSSEGKTRSLFYSTSIETLRAQYPEHPMIRQLSDDTRIIVSEPLGDLAGVWNEVPEATYGIVREGQDELHPFEPLSR